MLGCAKDFFVSHPFFRKSSIDLQIMETVKRRVMKRDIDIFTPWNRF